MKKYFAMGQGLAGRFGWGVVISSFSYINILLAMTTGIAFILLCVFLDMFGISPGTPAETGNPIGWVLYMMLMLCYGWYIWSIMAAYLLIPLGGAFSLLDLMAARKNNNAELYRGSVAGLCLAIIPVAMSFQNPNAVAHFQAFLTPFFLHYHLF